MAKGVQCKGKKAYSTSLIASKALDLIWKSAINGQTKKKYEGESALPCRTYQCAECRKWHLTSKARRPSRTERERAPQ